MKWFVVVVVALGLVWGQGCELISNEIDVILSCEEVRCPNADAAVEYTEDGTTGFACAWSCTDYYGAIGVSVGLNFTIGDDGCWELTSEDVSAGFCE